MFVAGAGRRAGVSYNVGIIRGGIAVNAIPSDAIVEVDLRATVREHLDRLEDHLKRSMMDCAAGANVLMHTVLALAGVAS